MPYGFQIMENIMANSRTDEEINGGKSFLSKFHPKLLLKLQLTLELDVYEIVVSRLEGANK